MLNNLFRIENTPVLFKMTVTLGTTVEHTEQRGQQEGPGVLDQTTFCKYFSKTCKHYKPPVTNVTRKNVHFSERCSRHLTSLLLLASFLHFWRQILRAPN